uniref:Uncharacterized protein n=1 Tax=Palpitomonas bilix TaxID=652834 RepID=A0A7S3D4R3_9EUKA|mmetsp:Transcript_21591/g.56066  ORF Transcript_21591/g.56066 Transcript_21591/m.56066 type:complete len:648 (+) Transcript_21591:314-2257(+)
MARKRAQQPPLRLPEDVDEAAEDTLPGQVRDVPRPLSNKVLRIAVLYDGCGLARLGLEQAGCFCVGFESDPVAHHLSKSVGSGNCKLVTSILTIDRRELEKFDGIWANPPRLQVTGGMMANLKAKEKAADSSKGSGGEAAKEKEKGSKSSKKGKGKKGEEKDKAEAAFVTTKEEQGEVSAKPAGGQGEDRRVGEEEGEGEGEERNKPELAFQRPLSNGMFVNGTPLPQWNGSTIPPTPFGGFGLVSPPLDGYGMGVLWDQFGGEGRRSTSTLGGMRLNSAGAPSISRLSGDYTQQPWFGQMGDIPPMQAPSPAANGGGGHYPPHWPGGMEAIGSPPGFSPVPQLTSPSPFFPAAGRLHWGEQARSPAFDAKQMRVAFTSSVSPRPTSALAEQMREAFPSRGGTPMAGGEGGEVKREGDEQRREAHLNGSHQVAQYTSHPGYAQHHQPRLQHQAYLPYPHQQHQQYQQYQRQVGSDDDQERHQAHQYSQPSQYRQAPPHQAQQMQQMQQMQYYRSQHQHQHQQQQQQQQHVREEEGGRHQVKQEQAQQQSMQMPRRGTPGGEHGGHGGGAMHGRQLEPHPLFPPHPQGYPHQPHPHPSPHLYMPNRGISPAIMKGEEGAVQVQRQVPPHINEAVRGGGQGRGKEEEEE